MKLRKAILIIHGFAGGTYDEEILANYLELNRCFDVYSFTLPGHDVKSRESSTCSAWIKSSEEHLQNLIDNGYKTIYIIGHSMGGVIASYLAYKHKEVKRLVLAAPAFTHLASKEEGGLFHATLKSGRLIKTYSLEEFLTRFKKLPISAVPEFLKLVNIYGKYKNKIKVPTLLMQGESDEVVPPKSTEELYDKIKSDKKEYVLVSNYSHDLFRGEKKDILCEIVKEFLLKPKFLIKSKKIKV